ncbi:hypothetical protein BBP40_003794 [Aspergillus hancockii]|nr:hypothetical protein BBP40_003794 [Aspergillus hancockii]
MILPVLFYFPPGWDAKYKGMSKLEAVKRFDYVGFVLYAGGLILVLLGLSWGGTSYAWNSTHVVSVFVVGFVCLGGFVLYEIFVPLEQPLLPMSLLRDRGYSATVGSAIVGNMVYFSMSLLWPKMIGLLFTSDTIKAGWLSVRDSRVDCMPISSRVQVSVGCGVIVGEIARVILMKPLGYSKYQLIVCTIVATAFSGALGAINQHRQAYGIAFTAVGGFAVGYLELVTLNMCPLFCTPDVIGLASGFLGSAKQVGRTIANLRRLTFPSGHLWGILNNRIATTLPANVSEAATHAGLPRLSLKELLHAVSAQSSEAMQAVPGMDSEIMAAVSDAFKIAYSQSFRTVFLATIAFGAVYHRCDMHGTGR